MKDKNWMKFNLTPQKLKASEKSIFSQGGQDGVIEAIFEQLHPNLSTFVEFGARDGVECSNTANLRINEGWIGLLMDSEPLADIVKKETITKDNINEVLAKNGVLGIDLLSIDVDGNDYWIWEAIKKSPMVVVIEHNSKFKTTESYSIEYNPEHKWEGDDYYGASLLALKKLGQRKGYTLVYVVERFDAVFVSNDLISSDYIVPTLEELFPEPIIAFDKVSNKKWVGV